MLYELLFSLYKHPGSAINLNFTTAIIVAHVPQASPSFGLC